MDEVDRMSSITSLNLVEAGYEAHFSVQGHAALACRSNTPVNEPTSIVQVTRTFLLIMTRNDSNGHVVFFWKRSDLQDMISFIDAVMWPLSFPMKRS